MRIKIIIGRVFLLRKNFFVINNLLILEILAQLDTRGGKKNIKFLSLIILTMIVIIKIVTLPIKLLVIVKLKVTIVLLNVIVKVLLLLNVVLLTIENAPKIYDSFVKKNSSSIKSNFFDKSNNTDVIHKIINNTNFIMFFLTIVKKY